MTDEEALAAAVVEAGERRALLELMSEARRLSRDGLLGRMDLALNLCDTMQNAAEPLMSVGCRWKRELEAAHERA